MVCLHCGKEYVGHSLSKYCSDTCRYRYNFLRSNKAAKEIKCKWCGEKFKRRSAKDVYCVECKNIDKKTVKQVDNYKLCRELTTDESSMIEAFLNKTK